MQISIVGSGYVGATLAGCLAELGHQITAVDIDADVVEQINAGTPPIVEPGLDALFEDHVGDRLRATTNIDRISGTQITFLTVQTPASQGGRMDTGALESACRDIGRALADSQSYHLVVIKSTILPGIAEDLLWPAIREGGELGHNAAIGLAVNPEFQAQGSAVEDFMTPDKLVFGTRERRAEELLRAVYEPLIARADPPVVQTGLREASMIKYANNVFLAAKISVMNELGNIGKEHGVDSYEVASAMGLDGRIGAEFLESGAGWGGSCLPGDEQLWVTDGGVRRLCFEDFFQKYVQATGVSDVSVLSGAVDGTFGFKRVTGATKRSYKGELRTFAVGAGTTVSVTSDHPMIVMDGAVPTVVEADTVVAGDRVPVAGGAASGILQDIPERSTVSAPARGPPSFADSPPTGLTSRGMEPMGRSLGDDPMGMYGRGTMVTHLKGAGAHRRGLDEVGSADRWNRSCGDLTPTDGRGRGVNEKAAGHSRSRIEMPMETGSGAARFQTTPVKSVSTARASTDVYSIEVAENHTFVTTGGVLVHNCFPKDTAALMSAARRKGYEPDLLGEVVAVNEKQPRRMVELLERHIQLGEARVAVLGAAFKPGTDDTRGTRARPLIESLARRGATPVVYDPTEAAEVLVHEHEAAILADSAGSALDGADGAAVITDWDEFATLDSEFDLMAQPVVIDGRRIISRREGLTYEGLTW